jgi:predicted secreted protein
MGVVTIILVFIIVWWLSFFFVLPIGQKVRTTPAEPGHAPSAPELPALRKRAAITTVLAVIITTVIVILVDADVVTFTNFDGAP